MMTSNKMGNLLYKIGDWLAKLIYLHIIWLFFTLSGLVLLGFIPATAAMFAVLRKWLLKEEQVHIFHTFLKSYKSYFLEANILGMLYLLIGLFLYIDFRISYTQIQLPVFHIIIWLVCFLYFSMVTFSFQIYVHYQLKKISYLKQTFLVVLSSPIELFLVLISLTIAFYLFYFVPVIFILTGSTIIGFPLMWAALRAFRKIERKISLANN